MKNEILEVCVNESFSNARKAAVIQAAKVEGFDVEFRIKSRYETTQVNYSWNDEESRGNNGEADLVKSLIAKICTI